MNDRKKLRYLLGFPETCMENSNKRNELSNPKQWGEREKI